MTSEWRVRWKPLLGIAAAAGMLAVLSLGSARAQDPASGGAPTAAPPTATTTAAPAAAPAAAPKPDPSGLATGDKTTVQDASGTPFVPPSPADSDDAKTKADKQKALDAYNAQAAKEPLAAQLADGVGHVKVATNMAWVLNTGYLVLFMQAGFALLTCGLIRKKNAGHLMMLNFAAYVIAFVGYYAVGFAFQFGAVSINNAPGGLGGTPTLAHWLIPNVLGKDGMFLKGPGYDSGAFALFMFEVVFMETAGYIIVGAICERITFGAFVLCELFIGAILYPAFGAWVWGGGWLAMFGSNHPGWGHGYCDFAGSTVVHAIGGFAAMALAVVLGPRIGKYKKDGSAVAFPGHNVVFVVTGTFILLFGWMGFNPGSTLQATDLRISVIAVNTNLAAVFGALAAMIFWKMKFGKPDISMACNGMLAGLVAITAPCAYVDAPSACIIGILAGLVVCLGVLFNDKIKVDDPCGAISVHGYCGILGGICLGIFADGTYGGGANGVGSDSWLGVKGQGVTGLLHGDFGQFKMQVLGALVCAGWAFGATFIVFKVVNGIKSMRPTAAAELEGLDVPEFGGLAYPEDEYPTSGVVTEGA